MTPNRKSEIIEQAESLVAIYSAPPIPALEIAERHGVDVVFSDLNQYKNKVSGFIDFENKRMLVNDDLNLKDKAFTMAHELGHWILHRKLFEEDPTQYTVMPRLETPDLTSKYEVEANLFASHLLIPTKLLDKVKDNPAGALARVFLVSQHEMATRLVEHNKK